MLLVNADQSIEATVVTAIATHNLECAVEYEDRIQERITPGVQYSFLAAGIETILDAPKNNTARKVREIHILNNDTITHNVIVSILDDVTLYDLKKVIALPADKTLHYNEYNGWIVI